MVADGHKLVGKDTHVKLRCKGGVSGTSKYYRVLGVFQKYYTMCVFPLQDLIGWNASEKKEELRKTRVLTKLVEKAGSCVRVVALEKGGSWGPQHVYAVKGLDELLEVHGEIEGVQLTKGTTSDQASKMAKCGATRPGALAARQMEETKHPNALIGVITRAS